MARNKPSLASELASIASAGALSVAPYLRKVARTVASHETKRDHHDPVTIHDRKVENELRSYFAAAVPGSRVLGEEYGEETLPGPTRADSPPQTGVAALGARVRWIVDPIDGTANFAAGSTYFGTSVAAELDGEVVAGAITIPYTGELFYADLEEAWHVDPNGSRTRMNARGPRTESEALLVSYYPSIRALRNEPEASMRNLTALSAAFMVMRRTGASALDLAHVAAGWQGALLGVAFGPWDVAAGIHMVRVAGGQILNLGYDDTWADGLRPALLATSADLDAPTARRVLTEVVHTERLKRGL